MGVVLDRLVQTIRLERDAFVWMDFNDRATGDAAIIVVVTQVLMALGFGYSLLALLHPMTLISLLISALFSWVVYAGATYGVSRFVFDGHGTYAVYLRITGFAAPTLLLAVFINFLVPDPRLAFLAGGVWFIFVVANGLTYIADLSMVKAVASALGGYILMVVIGLILGSVFAF